MRYIRKSGVIFVVILVLIFVLLNIFLTDKWLERTLEKAGEGIVGAKVEIDNLDFSILDLSFKWNRLQVAHPEIAFKNMIETGPVEFKLSPSALLKRKVVIEKMKVLNIKTFTDRKTDGRLPKKKEEKKEPSFIEKQFAIVLEQVTSTPAFDILSEIKTMKVEDIIDKVKLETPNKVDSIKKEFISRVDKIRAEVESIEKEIDSLRQIERNLRSLNVRDIKTVDDLKRTRDVIVNTANFVKGLKGKYDARINEVKDLKSKIESAKLEFQDAIKSDLAKVKDYAKIPDISKMEVVRYLIGPKLFSYYLTYLRYSDRVEKAVEKLQATKPEKEKKPPRFKGQDIHFVKEKALPNFWLKQCEISGETNGGFFVKGELLDVSSQPKIVGKPTIFSLEGTRPDKAQLHLKLVLDFVSSPQSQKLQLGILNFPIVDLKFDHNVKYLPIKLARANGDFNFEIFKQANLIELTAEFNALNPVFAYQDAKFNNQYEEKVAEIFKQTFNSVKNVDAKILLSFKGSDFDVRFNSTLDRQLTQGFKDAVGREIERIKQNVEKAVREKIDSYLADFEKIVESKLNEAYSKLEQYNVQINEFEKLKDAKLKEIEDEIKRRGGKLLEQFFRR
jgi:uncharacterized protein (TIGR03545 family)